MQVAECPHTMVPTLGAKFVVTGVTSPSTGRWPMLWAEVQTNIIKERKEKRKDSTINKSKS